MPKILLVRSTSSDSLYLSVSPFLSHTIFNYSPLFLSLSLCHSVYICFAFSSLWPPFLLPCPSSSLAPPLIHASEFADTCSVIVPALGVSRTQPLLTKSSWPRLGVGSSHIGGPSASWGGKRSCATEEETSPPLELASRQGEWCPLPRIQVCSGLRM